MYAAPTDNLRPSSTFHPQDFSQITLVASANVRKEFPSFEPPFCAYTAQQYPGTAGRKRGKREYWGGGLDLMVVGRQLRRLGRHGGGLRGRGESSRGVGSGGRDRGRTVCCIGRYGGGAQVEGRDGSVFVIRALEV